MSLNCQGCTNLPTPAEVASEAGVGHCTVFVMAPQIDHCEMHSDLVAARKAAKAAKELENSTPGYLWLGTGHISGSRKSTTYSLTK